MYRNKSNLLLLLRVFIMFVTYKNIKLLIEFVNYVEVGIKLLREMMKINKLSLRLIWGVLSTVLCFNFKSKFFLEKDDRVISQKFFYSILGLKKNIDTHDYILVNKPVRKIIIRTSNKFLIHSSSWLSTNDLSYVINFINCKLLILNKSQIYINLDFYNMRNYNFIKQSNLYRHSVNGYYQTYDLNVYNKLWKNFGVNTKLINKGKGSKVFFYRNLLYRQFLFYIVIVTEEVVVFCISEYIYICDNILDLNEYYRLEFKEVFRLLLRTHKILNFYNL